LTTGWIRVRTPSCSPPAAREPEALGVFYDRHESAVLGERPAAAGPRHDLPCIQYPDVDGAGVGCSTRWNSLPTRQASDRSGATCSAWRRTASRSARVTYPNGVVRTAAVHDNFFTYVDPRDDGVRGTGYSPHPRVPRADWLGARGQRVGP
jgi:hypothetical protein